MGPDWNKGCERGSWKRKEKHSISQYSPGKTASIFFLLDHDVLVKVGKIVRYLQCEKSRDFHIKNKKKIINHGYIEKTHRLHQDIHMYGICHNLLNCPIRQISSDFCWTRTYSLPTFWSRWLSIIDNIRILGECYSKDIVSFAQTGHITPPLISQTVTSIKDSIFVIQSYCQYTMSIGVSRIIDGDRTRLCIRDFREPDKFQPEHLLDFKNYDASFLKGVPMNTIYI